jgi:hypothetical protein
LGHSPFRRMVFGMGRGVNLYWWRVLIRDPTSGMLVGVEILGGL